jgi:glycosyltransferase involved in cell wall biosynthesis
MVPELDSGGVERGTLEIGRYLIQHGHRSIVISGGGRLVGQLESEGSEHLLWEVGKKSPMTLRFVPRLKKFLSQQKVDILHLRSRVPAWVGYLAWKNMPEHARPRLVTTFHGFYSVNRYSAVMANGEKVIAISEVIKQHIIDNYNIPPARIEMIHRGFDQAKFTPSSVTGEEVEYWVKKWNLAEERPPVIMLPGRLTRLKGHDVFINALKIIEDLHWQALCVGDFDEKSGYFNELQQALRDLQINKRVMFVGHCDNMPVAYKLSDIVVSATSTKPEAFGRIAVEALAMERPVIASAQGGSMETVLPGKTGWLVEPKDPGSLADALREAILHPDICRKYGESGRNWVLENFTTEKMCHKTVELYRCLIFKS